MILDTNALSALLDLDPEFIKKFASQPHWFIPVVVLGEYRFGLKRSRYRTALEKPLRDLEESEDILPITANTALHYATIREALRDIGKPIPVNDLWIAALGREHGYPIVTRDKHFDDIEGVTTHSW